MKYLLTQENADSAENVFCESEEEIVSLVEEKVRSGAAETDIKVFSVEPINFHVERVPVVKLTDSVSKPDVDVADMIAPDMSADAPVEARVEATKEIANPFVSEQVFSIDS